MNSYLQKYDIYKRQVEQAIEKTLNLRKSQVPKLLQESMEYSVYGGKCIRGILAVAVGDIVGADMDDVLKYAAAIEMIHASSLIHDDLPCMDNDTMRRGKPCNHIMYGEANALYAGLGLMNLAYEGLLMYANKQAHINALKELATSAGVTGIMKGQSLDSFYEGKDVDFETLKTIHLCKTGVLIKSATIIPCILAECNEKIINAFMDYGTNIGTAFQIIDDVLDVTASSDDLGKTAGKDFNANKITYVKLFGVDKATQMAQNHVNVAIESLDSINMDSGFLKETAKLILNRRN